MAVGAAEGDTFAVAAPHGEAERERRWPRSTAGDLEEAVRAAEAGAERWRELPLRERARALRAVLRQVESELADAPELAAFLGVASEELEELQGSWRTPLELRASKARLGHPGVAVVAPDWSELAPGFARALVEHASAGRGVVMLSDHRFPHWGDLWSRAWSRRAPIAEALSVVHGAGPDEWRAALALEGVTDGVLSGGSERLNLWSSEELPAVAAGDVDVEERELTSSVACVELADDIEGRAADLVERSFGRRVLAGQRPGQVGRIFCNARVFSSFVEIFLAIAEDELQARSSLPFIDREGWYDLTNACKLGLDEGATQILGGDRSNSAPRGGRPPVHPAVFTNVEPGMRLLARTRAAPLVSLVRAPDDHAAHELARGGDGAGAGAGEG